jgi:hypothetical protein
MKFPSTCILFAVASFASAKNHAMAFAPLQVPQRVQTALDVTTLEDWQILDNGSVVGSVRGHPSLNDGDIITTSPLADPRNVQGATMVTTLTGSQYMLGNPMQMRMGGSYSGTSSEPGLDRGTLIKGTGLAALFASGLTAGYGLSGGLDSKLTVPEVSALA